MKTSKYLIIALVAFVLVAELIFSIDALNAAKNGRNAYPDYIKQVDEKLQIVPSFSGVKVYPNINIEIKKAEEYKIEYTYYKDSTFVLPKYRIVNNVLHIDTIPNNSLAITVYAPEINTIEGMVNNKVTLHTFSFSELNIEVNKGRVRDYGRDTIKCNQLKIKAVDSRINFYGTFDVDSVDLNLTHSSVHFEKGKKGTLKAVLNNKSRIETNGFSEMQIKKDVTSKLFVR